MTSRFLEHFILNGPDPKALDSVLNQLSDPNRKQPQDLDKAVIGMWADSIFCTKVMGLSHGTEGVMCSLLWQVSSSIYVEMKLHLI